MTTTHLRFDNEEVNEIQDLLESCGNDETMDIGVIDGFFTALSVLKNPRPDDVVIPYLFSVTGDAAAVPKNERLFELLTLRRNVVNAALRAGNGLDPIILPILDDDENPIEGPDGIEAVSPWCAGFFMGLFQGASEKRVLSDAAHAALAVIAELDGTGLLDHIVSINTEKEYDIVLQYDGRYEIRLGGTEELSYKIDYLTVILSKLSDFQAGVIDLTFSDSSEARFYSQE